MSDSNATRWSIPLLRIRYADYNDCVWLKAVHTCLVGKLKDVLCSGVRPVRWWDYHCDLAASRSEWPHVRCSTNKLPAGEAQFAQRDIRHRTPHRAADGLRCRHRERSKRHSRRMRELVLILDHAVSERCTPEPAP